MKKEFKRNLPHFYVQDAIYDINFRLANTIPKSLSDDYYLAMKKNLKNKQNKNAIHLYNEMMDDYLDHNAQHINWLTNEKIRLETISSINFNHKKLYSVIAFCIMPNHVHLIINTFRYPYIPLGEILKSIKQFSSTQANKILHRDGQFWHHESYDHIIKSRNELATRINYIKNNPVKAGLVTSWRKWNGTFVEEKYIDD